MLLILNLSKTILTFWLSLGFFGILPRHTEDLSYRTTKLTEGKFTEGKYTEQKIQKEKIQKGKLTEYKIYRK